MISLLGPFRGFSRNARLLLAAVSCVGLSMALNTLFFNFYLQRLGHTQQFIGLANALPFILLVIVGFPIGRVVDRHGPRRGLLIGIAAAAAGALGIALSNERGAILGWAAVMGVGSAFGFISIAPFQMASSTDHDRVALFSAHAALLTGAAFLGNLLGGTLPGVVARLAGAPADALLPLRGTMLVVAAVWALGMVPVLLTRLEPPSREGADGPPDRDTGRRRLLSRPGVVVRLLVPAFLISLGAGQTMPFLNLYISGKFGIDFARLGVFFALGAMGTTVATLVQPVLAARVGKIQSVLLVQVGSIPFLLALGFVPVFWLVAISFIVRNALMNMGNPVYQAFAQEQIAPGERATYSSLASIAWSLGWAGGSAFSGWWRGRVGFEAGFNTVFALMTLLYVAAIALLYLFFGKTPRPAHTGEPRG